MKTFFACFLGGLNTSYVTHDKTNFAATIFLHMCSTDCFLDRKVFRLNFHNFRPAMLATVVSKETYI